MSNSVLRNRTRAIVVLLTALMIINITALQALAVQAPRPSSSLFIQTSGPNAGLGIGDYYSSPAGGDTDHLFIIRVPSDWPAGTPVTVALYDPEVGGVNPASPTAADEVRNAADRADFRLESPSGSAVVSMSYNDLTTNGVWTELATFDPGTTGTGTYLLRARVSDDDDNSWRVDASHDPDCLVGSGCPAGTLVNGNESPVAPAGSGPLAVGVIRTSWQHEGPGSSCQDHVFYVNSATPRPLRAHNFDMDGNGSVTYTTPTGASVAGTISANAAWNNSSNANRVGDILPDINGWWSARICISSTNQYVFESPSAGPSFPEPQPAPRLTVSKTDSVDTVLIGEELTYTITVDNVSDEDALPGDAYDVVAVDDLPDGLGFVACSSVAFTCSESGGVVTASLDTKLEPGTAASFEVVATVTGGAGLTITNQVVVDYDDHLGNAMEDATASDVDAVDYIPALAMSVSGPVEVLRGDSATLTYTVEHDPSSDQSPVAGISVSCALCSTIAYASGDADSDGILDWGEAWVYAAAVTTGSGDPDVILATAVANGLDLNGEPVTASATGEVVIIEPASVSGVVFEDLNGNGALDAGEPGLAAVTVELSGPGSPVMAVTDADGQYEFTHLEPGDYGLAVVGALAPLVATSTSPVVASLSEGEAFGGADFGFALAVTISGTMFADTDFDGLLDPAEGGLAGVTMTLHDSSGLEIDSTTTGPDGSYSFEVAPGEYEVRVGSGVPTGWIVRTPTTIETGLLVSGTVSAGNDFGASNHAPVLSGSSQTIEVGETPVGLAASDSEGSAVSFSLAGGALPAGVTLNADGTFDGAASLAGDFTILVEVCDDADPAACATFEYTLRVRDVAVAAEPHVPNPTVEQEGVDELPFTGSEIAGLIMAAGALLAGGGLLVLGVRARESLGTSG